MNNKIFIFTALVFSLLGFAFVDSVSADSNDETQNVNYSYSGLDQAKEILVNQLDNYNTDLVSELGNLKEKFEEDKNYLILKSLNKINIGDINVKMLEQYFSIKTSLVSEYTTINSNFLVLDEKKKYGLISDTEYSTQKTNLTASIDAYFTKYLSLITGFNDVYGGENGLVSSFSGTFATLKSSNQNILSGYVKQYDKLDEIISKYKVFDSYVSQIKNLYDINYDNIYNYISDVKNITASDLQTSLTKNIETYYTKYKNLSYYSGDISLYTNSIIDTYKLEIDNYLISLIQSFYTKDDYDFIVNNYDSFENIYLSGGTINFDAMINNSLSGVYTKLNTTLDSVNANIKSKLENLNNPGNLSDVQTILNKEVENYYAQNKQTKIEEFKKYLDKEVELLTYKTSQELDSYNVIITRLEQAQLLSGTEQVNSLKSLAEDLQKFASGLVDQSLKSQSMILRAQTKIQYIDSFISNGNFEIIAVGYSDIDNQLKKIMVSLEEDASSNGKTDELKQKIISGIGKIEELLLQDNVSKKNQYLLLKIEKVFIRFIYIK